MYWYRMLVAGLLLFAGCAEGEQTVVAQPPTTMGGAAAPESITTSASAGSDDIRDQKALGTDAVALVCTLMEETLRPAIVQSDREFDEMLSTLTPEQIDELRNRDLPPRAAEAIRDFQERGARPNQAQTKPVQSLPPPEAMVALVDEVESQVDRSEVAILALLARARSDFLEARSDPDNTDSLYIGWMTSPEMETAFAQYPAYRCDDTLGDPP